MRKKAVLFILVFMNIFLLSGCWNYVEIDQTISVAGFAVDVGQRGYKYHLSAETISVGKRKDGEIEAEVIETDGNTVFECVRKLMELASKKLYFGHCKTIIIGEELAVRGITEVIDLPIRNHEMRSEIDLMIAKDSTGRDFMMTEGLTTPIASYKLYNLTRTFPISVGEALTHKMYKIYNNVHTDGVSTIIPALEIRMAEEQRLLKLAGGAVFCGDRLTGYIDNVQVKYLSIITNKLKTGLITIEDKDNTESFMSFEIYRTSAKTRLSFGDDGPKVNISVNMSVIVGEIESEFDFSKSEEIEKTRHLLEDEIQKKCTAVIEQAQKDYGCDLLGICVIMQRDYPEKWELYKAEWSSSFEKIPISVESTIRITGSGVNNRSTRKRSE
ncbi:MAG: Ger(x)C family spore germination protein [Oscillospiraceae bacterium]|nr:Ger(x)C family spore germination protein [Oscillospiraceae bacterium]